MKKVIIIFLLINSILIANNYESNDMKNEFGVAAGMNIGYGLTFKHRIDESFSVRATGGYIEENNKNFYNFGLEINYSVKKNNLIDIYFSIGALHTYEETSNYYYYSQEDENITPSQKETRAVIGIGISSYYYDTFSLSIEAHQVFEYSIETDEEGYRFNIYPMLGFTFGILF